MLHQMHLNPFIIRPPDDFVQNNLDLKNMSHRLTNKYVDRQIVTDDDLQIMGRMLWNTLDIQNDFDATYSKCRAEAVILPIIIESNIAEVQALPWETLFHPEHGFLGKHPAFTLTRRIVATNISALQLQKGPLRVLLFTSLPEDVNPEMGRLNVEEEQFQVQEALLPWITKGLVQLEMPDDGRFSTLKELLKSFQPHVLFLSGHGRFHHAPHAGEAYGEFFFESEVGDSEAVKEREIANALSNTNIQVVILTACESGKAAESLSNGLLRQISVQGSRHVIGMRETISDAASIAFTRNLCNVLANQKSIDFALQCARQDIAATDDRAQWCLPILISSNPHTPLIDWDFQPREPDGAHDIKNTLGDVHLPARFIGRRAELRQYKSRLFKGQFHKLLITGPGGQGKTSLAGKLAWDLQQRGWQLFAWSARLNKSWRDFELELEQTLEKLRVNRYNQFWPRAENEQQRAKFMLNLLMEQFNGRAILFLDNLESVQDPHTQAISDALIAAWLEAARATPDLVLLATSRWQIPGWDGEQLRLARASYGDFLQMVQGFRLPATVLEQSAELRRAYEVLGGNGRGLELFASTLRDTQSADEERSFLDALVQAKADLQANKAIEEIYKRLPTAAQTLFRRLPVYPEPVPLEGLVQLGPDLTAPEALLERLLAVSLLEASYEPHWEVPLYQCDPLAADWLNEQNLADVGPTWLNAVVDYHLNMLAQEWQILHQILATHQALRRAKRHSATGHLSPYLRAQKRQTLHQALAAYYALRRAERHSEADRLTLDHLVGPLTLSGSYQRLLTEFLPRICSSPDLHTRGRALAHTGILLKNTGRYEEALAKHHQALAIMRQMLDQRGEGAALNNLAMVHQARGEFQIALAHLEQALAIQRQIGDKAGEGATLSNLAQTCQAQSDYWKALEYQEQALEIQRQFNDPAGEGITLNNIATIFQALGEYEKALAYLRQGLVIQQQIGDKASEATTLNNISGVYQRQNDYETALKYLKQARAAEQQIGDKTGEATTINNISGIYRRLGEYETALDYLQQSLYIQAQIGDKAGEGLTLNNIGTTYQMQGEYEQALTYLDRALDIRQELGDRAGEAQSLNNIATVRQAQGDHQAALEILKRALTIVQNIGGKAGESTTLNNIATVFQARGDYKTALEYLEQALAISQQIGDRMGQGTTLNNMATLYEALQDYSAAMSKHQQALAIRQQISDQAGEAQSLNNLSQIYRSRGALETALQYLKQAQVIQEQIGNQAGLCTTFFNRGHIHFQNGQVQEALDAWVQAYILARHMKLSLVLQALDELGPQVDLPKGPDGWQSLAQKTGD